MPVRTDYFNIHEREHQRLRAAGKHSWSEPEDTLERLQFYSTTLQKYHPSKFGRILILGCGDGETTIGLSAMGYKVRGIDISPTAVYWALDKARVQNQAIEFETLDVVKDQLATAPVDVVIDDHLLHCIVGVDRGKVLSKIFSQLNQGGIFLVRTQCGDPPASAHANFLETWDPVTRCQIHNGISGRYFGKSSDILNEIKLAGFTIEENRSFNYPTQWEMLEVVAVKK